MGRFLINANSKVALETFNLGDLEEKERAAHTKMTL